MPSINHLPTELHVAFASFCSLNDLLSLSATSKHFRSICIPIFTNHLDLVQPRRSDYSLHEFIYIFAPIYRHQISSICLPLRRSDMLLQTYSIFLGDNFDELLSEILSLTSNLKSLEFHIRGGPKYGGLAEEEFEETWAAVKRLKSLEKLTITGTHTTVRFSNGKTVTARPEARKVIQILPGLKALTCLRLRCVDVVIPTWTPGTSSKISHILLDRCGWLEGDAVEFFDHFSDTLTDLEVCDLIVEPQVALPLPNLRQACVRAEAQLSEQAVQAFGGTSVGELVFEHGMKVLEARKLRETGGLRVFTVSRNEDFRC